SELVILGSITLVACLLGLNEIIALFGCGLLGLTVYLIKKNTNTLKSYLPLVLFQLSDPLKIGTLKIFLTFLKVGAILYGSGYVLFAFLDSELVAHGWLTRQALIDAVAVGQMTPGPVLSTATFIGWQMNGIAGAMAATIGIFLPSFLFVLILNPLIPKMRKSNIVGALLDAVNVAAVALILAVCIQMGKDTLTDWRTILIAVTSLITVFYFKKLNSAFIVLAGALFGYVLTFI
ncbi:MAG: chromate transporter, partial [Maribacter sp.]|nr:chromate transporter [Maribacter sp.]